MFSKKELTLAYGVAVCLLVIGVISYAAFPLKAPQEPLRMMFNVTAGNVLFNHKIHTVEEGYGLSCEDCHHELLDDESEEPQACGECHDPEEGDEEVPKRADAFHQQCAGCHEDYEAGPAEKECTLCHTM
jgi:Zn finger protein HypA/HybF involved in hydrogenase expression